MSNARFRIFGFLIIAAALIAPAAGHVLHQIPREKLRRREPLHNQSSPGEAFEPKLDTEQEEFLKAHNDYRREAGMPPLAWSANLTADARAWAEARRGDCDYRLHSMNRHGENTFYMEYHEFGPVDVVQRWFSESRWYDKVNGKCNCYPEREGCECGHYLNMVCPQTTCVGCSGVVYCHNQKGIIIVCQYDPPRAVGIYPRPGTERKP